MLDCILFYFLVSYCSIDCQKCDWDQHKLECKLSKNIKKLLDSNVDIDNLLLMIRTFNNLKSAPENCSYSEDKSLHHKCGLTHCESLISYSRDLIYSEQLMIEFISETFLKSKEDVKKIYLSFENNNFGILDELL